MGSKGISGAREGGGIGIDAMKDEGVEELIVVVVVEVVVGVEVVVVVVVVEEEEEEEEEDNVESEERADAERGRAILCRICEGETPISLEGPKDFEREESKELAMEIKCGTGSEEERREGVESESE